MEKYFASDTPDKAVETLISKSKNWFRGVTDMDYIEKIKRSWKAYHGQYYDAGHGLSSGGESGELVNLAVNHYRNLARHILVMVTSTRPSFQCRAINTDRKSIIQADLGNGLLDYYMREMKMEDAIKTAVEYAIILGSGYVKLEWNSTKGKIHDTVEVDEADVFEVDEEGNQYDEEGVELKPYYIHEGDIDFTVMSPFDVVFDPTKEHYNQNNWVLCRTFKNKFDIAAKYPEMAESILSQQTKDQVDKRSRRVLAQDIDETTDIPVYEFFHKRTESMPNGRYMLYVDSETILEDTVMPYRDLPVYRIVPANILGTPYGYADMWDLLPLQDMLNSLYSTAATNINAFGVQNILNPRGNDVMIEQVSEGMNFIEYNAAMGAPTPLDLVKTSPEVYQMMQIIEKTMETLSGVNAVARGNPEQSLRSGTALALVQSQALQFVSGLQQSYIRLLEDVGTGLVNLLKDFANVPRMAAIAGINNTTEMKEFKSDDIKSINRVVVDVGNALMQTTAGRAQVAENLLQMGLITSPEKYLMVMNTGNLDYLTEGVMDELKTVKGENEAFIKGEEVIALFSDHHSLHIKEHRDVLSDYNLRRDPELVKEVLDHIQEHINLLQTTDPNILAICGEQPLAPPGGSPVAPQGAPPVTQGGPAAAMGPNAPAAGQPGMPRPAGEGDILPEGMPTNPQELMAKNTGGQ
jgi:hypothetical protein